MRCARASGAGLVLAVKKSLEANGRDDGVFISLFPSLAISEAQASFSFLGRSRPLVHRSGWFSELCWGGGWQG